LVQIGNYVDTTFTISNLGVGELLGNVSEGSDQFDLVSGSGQYYLSNGQVHAVTVRFAPASAGSHQCTVETGTHICSDVTVTGSAYACPPDSVLYVNADASGAGDGTSWTDAFTDLQDALARADLCGNVTNIWVADGTYYPTSGSERDATFELRDNLAVYGGFAGTESSRSERDLSSSTTILSGDIGTAGDINDNSYHVVTGSYTDSTAVLDGFTITAGHASVVTAFGGGMFNEEGSPTLRNLIFRGNKARENGAGMYNWSGSNPRLYNCVFFDNRAEDFGGGICNIASSPVIVNCSFCRNRADDGGAALYNNTGSNPTVTNVVMWADSTDFMGLPEILNQYSSYPVISCSCIQYCGGSGSGWEGKYGIDGGGNTDRNAGYVDMATGDLHLLERSYAIDAGDSTVYGLPDTDIEGNPRIQDGNIDMGAYEGENNIITVSIDTHPGALEITVDSDTFTSLYSFDARSGTVHEIGAITPQVSGDTIFSFTGWSDAGDTVHNITVPQYDDVTFTATYSWAFTCALIDSVVDVPADQGGWARVYFRRSHYDNASEQYPIERYDLHRRVDDPVLAAAVISEGKLCEDGRVEYMGRIFIIEGEVSVQTEEVAGRSESPEIYTASPPGVWEVVGTVSAAQQAHYIALAPTNADSAATIPWAVYYLSAHSTNPSLFYDSPADSGYSVDNIAPGVPLGMAVAYNTGSGNQISWNDSPEPDFQYYRVYRGESEDFEPGPSNLVHETAAASWTDPDHDGSDVYYKVSALDHAGNESDPASPETITGDDHLPMPEAFALYQNAPNPFNPSTLIRFDLPHATYVNLRIYNAGGKLVAEIADGIMEAGYREIVWKGQDRSGSRVASGVYFYRLIAGDFSQTRKMVLLR
ncbi:MAG: T9SS type A sorting domain-containing protein, partial [Candidatus Latescibacteria bacterium]|nr:T9SS type A sorting domain-containing protein [bacterium]MBD3422974.1 T9SS type A sorting domain-containing protein [Candidatus Latescibacterota bacterium]